MTTSTDDAGTIAERATRTETHAALPDGDEERFAGYGVMGLPFTSGHVLAMRRFAASSIGPAYTAVWHRDPDGSWTFWQDQPAELGCARYFSAAVDETRRVGIDLAWSAPDTLRIAVPEVGLRWSATMRASTATTAVNRLGRALPDGLWRSARVLGAMGPVVGRALGAGRVGLAGVAPNGHRFLANPQQVWLVAHSVASLRGEDLGSPGPLDEQAALGDFRIPQRGVFALGRAFFEPPPPADG